MLFRSHDKTIFNTTELSSVKNSFVCLGRISGFLSVCLEIFCCRVLHPAAISF